MKSVFIAAIAAGLLSTAVVAAPMPQSSLIPLAGGIVAPNATLDISLAKLNPVVYKVNCTITDKNNAANPVVVSISGLTTFNPNTPSVIGDVTFNGTNVGGTMNYAQAELPAVTTQVQFPWVNTNAFSAIRILNLDQSDTISVDNCIAAPVLNS